MVDFPKNNRYVNLANQSINELADNNFGTRLKAGDTTKLSYLLLDGNGDSLDLEGFTATAVLKKDNLVAYKKDATLINDDGQYRCEFKITDVLEPSEKAYVVEFVLTKGEDKYIYPSDNDIPLTIEPSSLSAEEDIIRTSSEEIITGIIKGIPAIAKVDEHITNLDVHVTAEDKAKWQTHSEEITRLNEEKQTKLVAGDNVVINQETNEISVNVPDDVVRKNSSNQIELTDDPTSDNHATRKSYVDRKFSEVDLSDYARADHTHTSSDISDSITRIGTVASANKLIKTDSDGFIDFIAPSDSSPDKTVILKGYLDTKLGQKANSDHNHDSSYYQKIEYISDPGASDKANKPLKSNTNGGLTLTNPPTENTDAVNKLYVDSKVADISLPDSGMTQAQADERYIRSNAATSTLGRHLTVDASDDGNYSASLFLKKNSHQYEFYTNATGKFGAWDKTNERNLFSADRNSFRHDTSVDMANNRITNLPEPNGANQPATKSWTESQLDGYYAKTEHVHTINSTTNNKPIKTDNRGNINIESTPSSDNHVTNKQYVDGQINTVLQGIPGALGAAGFISQENADTRYARTEHTHVSSDITDTITAIGTSASANKIVKTDSTGFLNIVAPTDSSPGKSIVVKSYLDEKLGQKADSNHTHTGYLSESDVTIDIGGRNASSKVVKTGTDGQLNITADPTSDNHAVRKSYVDRKVREAGSSGGTVNGITQSTADLRYARASHTHDSADITNTTNRIGTSASANKVVKLDSSGFLDVVTPNDNSPGNSVIVKSYLESKLNEKASASELETLRNTITQLQNKIQTLEANAGKVKNSANDTYLDIWVGPENQKPSDSTDKLVFVEKG
ncbi:hypothetical protein B8A39_06760 [Dolosigranulum pigrum]|jgi:hypothetical protein|uniref:hypothetical protein n=2 Tax=Dolosigranulum pigrum TaxID=29394 RepID=UPI000DC02036|nr:hypothetical protein [Dolosigranulum pigrum]RAN51538.1 hypothetical protein B8A39_06760 [Dolosigranulum pigrum]DAP94009.1 MAG TPA: hypothetical protein [Caudoviricetes sp.]